MKNLPTQMLRFCFLAFGFVSLLTVSEVTVRPIVAGDVPLGSSIGEFRLTDTRGKEWSWEDFRASKATAFVFLGTECPLAKLYTIRLAELAKVYESRSIALVAVDANEQDSLAEMSAHARRHSLELPFLKDVGQKLADQLGASRTPEVCVVDAQRKLVYRGRIDDQHGIGYSKNKATANELQQVLDALIAGKEVPRYDAPAVGCLIGKKKVGTENSEVTYSHQIARILQKRCVSCHQEGDIGPMALTQYEEVSGWSEMILEVIRDQRMPPWHAKEGVGHFSNDRRMPKEEIEMFEKWVASGTPQGDPSQTPPPPARVAGWQLPREPDLVVPMSDKPFRIPATGEVRYQYFRVDPKLTEDKWIELAEIVPGNRSVVHHVLIFAREKGSRGNLDGERGFLFGYVPGTRVEPPLKGYAKKLPKESELIFQVHYTPVGTPQEDLTKIGFVFADPKTITHEIQTTSVVQVSLDIPPKAENHPVSAILPEKLLECELLSMSPHMHLRGKSFRYTALYPNGESETLLDVPAYDFNWQTEYRLTERKKLPEGTKIRGDATFDNSEKNLNNPAPHKRVRWGDQTYEEMMIGYFHVAVPIDQATGKSSEVLGERDSSATAKAVFRRLDSNGDKRLTEEEVPARFKPHLQRLDKNKDGVLEWSEL